MKPICAYRSGELLSRLAIGFLLCATLRSFARDDIKVYRVPKQPAGSAQALPAGHPELSGNEAPSGPKLKWKTPAGWTVTPPGEMRAASFNFKGQNGKQADVSVIPLPGKAGGDEANVNRWRGQVALPELPTAELKKTAEEVKVGEVGASLYDVSGTNTSSGEPIRILGVIHHREGTAWFFKMTGDDQVVASQKPAFIEFLSSIEFAAAETPGGLPPSHPPIEASPLPAGRPPVAATPVGATPTREGQPKWQVPTDWKEIDGGQFLVAKFTVTGKDNAQATVNVSRSAGDGGGLAGNVNRWRGQLGLTPLSAGELAKVVKQVKTSSGEASFVEMAGTDARSGQPATLIGAMVTQGGQAWFYKLMGDAKVVASQQAAFRKFVETVNY